MSEFLYLREHGVLNVSEQSQLLHHPSRYIGTIEQLYMSESIHFATQHLLPVVVLFNLFQQSVSGARRSFQLDVRELGQQRPSGGR
jgi:hypothetical protein